MTCSRSLHYNADLGGRLSYSWQHHDKHLFCMSPIIWHIDDCGKVFKDAPAGFKLRVCNENLILLYLDQNICLGYSKEPSQC